MLDSGTASVAITAVILLGALLAGATLELKVNYIRAVQTNGKRLTAEGRTVHVGRPIAIAEARVHDESGSLVAHGSRRA